MKINSNTNEHKISGIGITDDTLTGRGGLAFYAQYLNSSNILEIIENRVGHLRKSGKSKQISEIVRQLLIFFADGSHKAISALDTLKGDDGYAAGIERQCDDLISGSMATRFFKKFNGSIYRLLRNVINDIFIWRLHIEQPKKIVLHLDTMVLDNDCADKREGVAVTYKKVCGFQPLQINWGPYIVDMDFRSGEKHSNHGDDAKHAVKRLVELIREKYDKDVPIILSADSGFLSEENLLFFEERLNIHYVVIGKLYDSVYRPVLDDLEKQDCGKLERGNAAWICFDYESKLKSWKKARRTVLTSLQCHDDQYVMEGIRDTVMYTNLGKNEALDVELIKRGFKDDLNGVGIVKIAHLNGEEELNHRSIKEFMGGESLPFKMFGMNGAYYSLMIISHSMMEAFRKDVLSEVIPTRCYANTLRRIIFDIAAKITRHSKRIVLRLTRATTEMINPSTIWERCCCIQTF